MYFSTILKVFKRSRINVFINLLGLVIGISSAILIFLYVQNEFSYDQYHEKIDRIYRITANDRPNDGENHNIALANYFLAQIFLEEYPEVEDVVRLSFMDGSPTVKHEAQKHIESNFYFADPSVFTVFTYPLIHGDPETVLEDPESIVLSESTAKKYFGEEDPIGNYLDINNDKVYVTGVMKDLPAQSDIPMDAIVHMPDDWNDLSWVYTYVLFNDGFSESEFRNKLDATIASDVQPFYDEDEITIELQFQSLHDVHFTRGLLFDTPKSNKSYLYLFSLVGLLMLCMAAINYINLTLADGALRSKEVAVRKVAGADRASILLQIFGENVLITSLAFVMSLVLCIIVFPYFLQLTESKLSLSDFISFKPLFILFLVFVGINLLCSTYPALFFSSFSPAKVLKGKFIGGDKLQVQKVMLTTQFVISAGMIICTLVILKQMDFIRNRDSGLALDQVVKVPLPLNENAQKRAVQFRNALLQQSGIADASIAGFNAIPGGETDLDVFTVEGATETIKRVVSYIDVDDHYFDILDLDVIAGRRFIRDSEADKVGSYIVNEAYVSLMGWDSYEEDVLDRGVIVPDFYEQGVEGSIIGIVKDFNFRSVHHKIEPLIIVYSDEYPGFVLAKSATNNMTDVIGQIRDTWFNFYPEYVFDYAFLDEHYGKQYDKENTMYKLFSLFTALSIFITVLGLFSLSLITIRQKIKAIGIRRVLGASMVNLLGEFNKEFMVIIGIALLITMPLSWWIMNEWLDSFAYKAPLTMEVFIIAGLFSAFMTLITTSYHIIKAGNLNPVETLKHE